MILQQSPMAAVFIFCVFFNENKISYIVINILCKFGKDIFINEQDIKVYVKTRQTHGNTHIHMDGRHFIISQLRYLAGRRQKQNATVVTSF